MDEVNINSLLASFDGLKPGGCDVCDAEHETRNINGVWHITIKHDDWCPVLKRHQRRKKHG
jgi:hypothetical protein